MALMRSILLAASQNRWLRENAVNYPFVRRSVSRFMPGESLDAAMAAARGLEEKKIGTVFTNLGENVGDRSEALAVTEHYLDALRRIHESGLGTEISVKLTQLGLDLSPDFCFENLDRIIAAEKKDAIVWVDMEASSYVDPTLDIYGRALRNYPNVGICLQAYLYRTQKDVEGLLPMRPSIRLVKGAYKEPPEIAFPEKADVDANYVKLMKLLLPSGIYHGIATHDPAMIQATKDFVRQKNIGRDQFEFQMLYGIRTDLQQQLVREGYRLRIYIPFGTDWFPYFMRRLAERPANLAFFLRNLLPKSSGDTA